MKGGPIAIAMVGTCAAAAIATMFYGPQSQPAAPKEIRAAIAAAEPDCRDLVRERFRSVIVRDGLISRRKVDLLARVECGPVRSQYEATFEDGLGAG